VTAPTWAVGFDFDHTLGLDNGLEVIACYRFAAALGHALRPANGEWSATIATLLARFRAGETSLDEMVEMFAQRLGAAADPGHATQYRDICYALVDELVTPVDGAREVLAALAERGIPTAILTNGWSPLQYLKIARALDYHGPILVSDELGILKPAAAAFGKLIDVLGVPRERVWFVGDNPMTDIAGAKGAGLRAVWFDWEDVAYPADAPQPDVSIAHLREFLDVLRGGDVPMENSRR
jgi:putative hydrolase of the HAD superfamily